MKFKKFKKFQTFSATLLTHTVTDKQIKTSLGYHILRLFQYVLFSKAQNGNQRLKRLIIKKKKTR